MVRHLEAIVAWASIVFHLYLCCVAINHFPLFLLAGPRIYLDWRTRSNVVPVFSQQTSVPSSWIRLVLAWPNFICYKQSRHLLATFWPIILLQLFTAWRHVMLCKLREGLLSLESSLCRTDYRGTRLRIGLEIGVRFRARARDLYSLRTFLLHWIPRKISPGEK
jgi:hypothetical protein